jgi:hypothetical protein
MTLEWRIGTLLEKVKTRTRAEKSNYQPTVVATHCLFGARQTIFPAENTAKQPAFSEIDPCSQDGFPYLPSLSDRLALRAVCWLASGPLLSVNLLPVVTFRNPLKMLAMPVR